LIRGLPLGLAKVALEQRLMSSLATVNGEAEVEPDDGAAARSETGGLRELEDAEMVGGVLGRNEHGS
jgi:hypothetical protein